MIRMKDFIIIGIDHGYGNIKTENYCFPTGVLRSDTPPTFDHNVLHYGDTYYSVGVGHKNYTPIKTSDDEYYILTLAAIAMELQRNEIREAKVHIAAGLPLTWVKSQRDEFRQYLLQNREVQFSCRGTQYSITIVGVDLFPQGFAAVYEKLKDMTGNIMLCDIGNGTMNLLRIQNGVPDLGRMYTEKMGTQQCVNAIQEALMNNFQISIDEDAVSSFLISGTADIDKRYLKVMRDAAAEYVNSVFKRLAVHDYEPGMMQLYIVGGGGCLIRNFRKMPKMRFFIEPDICATAKGYEKLAADRFKKEVK